MATINGPVGGGAFLHGTDPGGDIINAYGNNNSLYSDSGTNSLNILNGGSNNDLVGGPGVDFMDGGTGTGNIASYQLSNSPVTASLANPSINTGDAAYDTYKNIHALTGTPVGATLYADNTGLPNQLWALGGTNYLYGGTGYTTFISGPGADLMAAGSGGGLADYEVAHSGVTVSLANPQQNTGEAAGDTYSNIHNIAGSAYDDVLYADNNGDNLLGNAGNNILHGGSGNDTLNGGPGANTLYGGASSDIFVFGGSAIGPGDVSMDPLAVLTSASQGIYSTIMDFDQGNSGHYDPNEFDSIDVAPLVSSQYNHGNGQAVSSLVRVVEDTSNTFANFQIDTDGSGSNWLTLAHLNGVPGGGSVHVILDDSQPSGSVLTVQGGVALTVHEQPGSTTGLDEWQLSNGQWAASVSPGSHPGDSQVVGVGDFNNDGTSDILWYSAGTGDVDEWQMANGTWAASIDLGPHPGSGWQVAGTGDFNGDGTSDVLWFNSGTGQTDIWEMLNGKWAASVSPGTHPVGYQVAGVGDFNHDGTSDVLFYNPSTGDVDEWTIVNGQWAGSTDIGSHPGSGWQIGGVGDFNGDGTSDLLWFNPSSGQTDIWEMANGKWAASVSPGTHPTGYQIAGIGDFNHDGTSDILFYNPTTGGVDEWKIANGQWAGSVNLGTHAGGGQIVGVGDFNHDGTSDVLWHI